MAIKLLTLNIEANLHYNTIFKFFKEKNPDIICMQEVLEKDFEMIKEKTGMKGFFLPTHTKTKISEYAYVADGVEGIVILTNLKHSDFKHYFYKGKGNIPEYTDPVSQDRALLYTTIEHEGKEYNIGTTHFTWSPSGTVTDEQRRDFRKLINYLEGFKEFIICGDFNAPRGLEIFEGFKEKFIDNVPKDIETTIDQNLHRKKGIMLVVDTIFSTPNYKISNVQLVDGVSDHKAIIADIE